MLAACHLVYGTMAMAHLSTLAMLAVIAGPNVAVALLASLIPKPFRDLYRACWWHCGWLIQLPVLSLSLGPIYAALWHWAGASAPLITAWLVGGLLCVLITMVCLIAYGARRSFLLASLRVPPKRVSAGIIWIIALQIAIMLAAVMFALPAVLWSTWEALGGQMV